jgi:hypothetical protein
VFCVDVQYTQCFVSMSSIYSVQCWCPVYTARTLYTEHLYKILYILNINTEHCIYRILTQNTVYTGHQHWTLYILDINTEQCIYWTLTQKTVYTGHSSIYSVQCWCPVYTAFCVYVQYIQFSVLMSSIYTVLCWYPVYTVFSVDVQYRTLYIPDINT